MNAFDIGGTVPTIGGATILLVIIGVLGRLWLGAEQRHLTELNRVNRAHDEELDERKSDIAQKKSDINELRKQLEELAALLDKERRERWRAEDVAAQALRQGGGPHAK